MEISFTTRYFLSRFFECLNRNSQQKYNHSFKTVPIAWVLMSRRTTKAYNKVFSAIKKIHPNFKPNRCITDYEKALQNALKQSFAGIKVYGCHFHFCQVCKWILPVKIDDIHLHSFSPPPPASHFLPSLSFCPHSFHFLCVCVCVLVCVCVW